jgi:glycerol uptake facilitator-like aquaporin
MTISQYLSEFVGTFILLAFVTRFKSPFIITLGFLLAIWISGDYSGGHINPAVSISQVFSGAMPASALPGYIVAQIAGAVSAVYLVKRFM